MLLFPDERMLCIEGITMATKEQTMEVIQVQLSFQPLGKAT